MQRLFLSLATFALIALALGGPAKADAVYTLSYDGCSGGCGNGQGTNNNTFGYVTLHQLSTNQVSVSVQLSVGTALGTDFVNTGNGFNHEPFAINVDKSITISNISNPTYFTVGPVNDAISGLGTFSNTIACTNNCPSGASGAQQLGNALVFTTSDGSALTIADFVPNSSGYYFAADVIGPSGNTGEVAATNAPTITGSGGTSVPEPASLLTLAAGLLALGAVRRLRRRPAITR